MKNLEELKLAGEAPEWMNSESFFTLERGYLLPEETPKQMYQRVAKAAASYYKDSKKWEKEFFDIMWKNWLCPASPVLSNMGTDRGLPISCLIGDTWLNTKSGGIQIKDIKIGDELLTHEGHYQKVIAKKSRMSSGDLFKLKIGTRSTSLEITGNHPVLTNLGWIRVDQLNPKEHFVATNYEIDTVEKDFIIDMKKYDNLICKVPEFIKVDEDLAWAIGIWCAEGSRTINKSKSPNGIRITMDINEKETVEKWFKIISEKFNLDGNIYFSESTRINFAKGETCKWITANINGDPIGEFFTQTFGHNCKDKILPEWLIDLPKNHLESFLDGVIESNVHLIKTKSPSFENRNHKNVFSITLSNPKLLLGIYNICLKLDIPVSLQMQQKPSKIGKTKYVYLLRSLVQNSIKLSKNNCSGGIIFGKARYCPILNLEHVDYNKEVFDITVENDNSFSAAGVIVHNCNSIHVDDRIDSIFNKNYELAILSKKGAGVGIYLGDIRARGKAIKGNGSSEGVIPWAKVYDTTIASVSQGSTRRGAAAVYLPIDHGDIEEFINIRRPTGDVNRRCLNINHGVCITDEWMNSMINGDKNKRLLWGEILKNRVETGEPYMFFTDNVNNVNPDCYKDKGLRVATSNICSEIFLHTDPQHSFVCCLSSMNLVKWNEWKDTNAVQIAVRFLDAVLEEYIKKSENVPGLEASRNSAVKGRAIGLGVLGWHTLLQKNMHPFDSFEAMSLNAEIFRTMRTNAEEETKVMAEELGEPEWCVGHNRRHTHLLAVAPTVSNSIISGGYSAGIEPIVANIYSQKSAKGTFIRKNPILENLLESKGLNTNEVWKSINEFGGSIQHLEQLSKEEKDVFLTARELNQHTIIKQAAQRQKWIDQGQSINLFFAANSNPKYIHGVHLAAWKAGLKSLYYLRSDGVIKGDLAFRSEDECKACEA